MIIHDPLAHGFIFSAVLFEQSAHQRRALHKFGSPNILPLLKVITYTTRMNSMDNNGTYIDAYYPVMGDITEPLISKTAHQAVTSTMRYLDFLCLLTGSYMTAGSQLLFVLMMQSQTTHPKSACHIACFWLAWTVWTCLVVFLVVNHGMRAWMRLVLRGRVQDWDEALYLQLHANYIVGSLVGTSLILQIASIVKSSPVAALLAAAAVLWSSFMHCVIPNTNPSCDDKGKGSIGITFTYFLLVGATIGLITGLSQLLLCVLLYGWTNTAASAGLFLIMWLGGITVICTAVGWAGMYLLDQDSENKERSMTALTLTLAGVFIVVFMFA
jgi:hypothetical protein